MALTGTIQANLVANLTKFSTPMKRAAKDVQTLEGRLKGLQSTAKFALGVFGIKKIENFVKNTLKEATTAGSALQEQLGARGVAAAEKLADAFDKIHLALQRALIEGLKPFLPLLQEAARLAQIIAQALPGGAVGKLAEQNAAGPVDVNAGVQKAIDDLIVRQTDLIRQRVGLQGHTFRNPFANPNESFTKNQTELLDAKINQLGFEIESLTAALNPVQKAVDAAKQPGFDVIRLFQQLGATRRGAAAVSGILAGGISPLSDLATRIGGGAASLLGNAAANARARAEAIAERAQQLSEQEPRRPGAFARGEDATLDRIAQITQANRGAKDFIDIAEEQLEQEKEQHEELIRAIEQRLPAAIRLAFPVPARF
jgi:hypothetical protein